MSAFAATTVPTQFVEASGIRFAHQLVRKLILVRTAPRKHDRGNGQGHITPGRAHCVPYEHHAADAGREWQPRCHCLHREFTLFRG
jgi:hypothetical protein